VTPAAQTTAQDRLSVALVRADGPDARERLLGLEAWQRALLAAHHGGCARLLLLAPPGEHEALSRVLATDRRLAPLGVGLVAAAPAEPHVALPAGVLVDAASVRALREGEPAPPARGVWLEPELPRAARTRALLRSLANPCDGVVDTWVNRPISRLLTRLLLPTGISPNAVTVLSCLIGLAGAGLVATGEWRLGVVGALLFQLGAAVDCVDGELARLTYRFSPIGARLDMALDNVTHVALFAAMAWAARPALGPQLTLLLGAMAVIGCAASFGLVYRLSFRPAARPTSSRVRALLDRLTNRDFSLLVIGAALLGGWQWLLLAIAVGTWGFWALLLLTAWRDPGDAPAG
jgi:phosphatidylglycerophosphate synthase